eukprot:scaffold36539_cov188-Isochrysis_galbana.AAC.2
MKPGAVQVTQSVQPVHHRRIIILLHGVRRFRTPHRRAAVAASHRPPSSAGFIERRQVVRPRRESRT